jgi:hypothetical protein
VVKHDENGRNHRGGKRKITEEEIRQTVSVRDRIRGHSTVSESSRQIRLFNDPSEKAAEPASDENLFQYHETAENEHVNGKPAQTAL